ncbi:hypothetical protein, partial [Ectobacillus panaciterrae]|uniref:hypothetical protein n=1 Tax=Ectobacillus panaciterrae TaxID=363872 RepID=UPI00055974AB
TNYPTRNEPAPPDTQHIMQMMTSLEDRLNKLTNYPTRNEPAPPDTQHIMQMMTSLEDRLDKLIKLIEDNNRLLRSIEQQSRVISGGGGAVIVRM